MAKMWEINRTDPLAGPVPKEFHDVGPAVPGLAIPDSATDVTVDFSSNGELKASWADGGGWWQYDRTPGGRARVVCQYPPADFLEKAQVITESVVGALDASFEVYWGKRAES